MRNSLLKAIDRYIKHCQKSEWIHNETYKIQFANYIFEKVNWSSQTDIEILETLKKSQKFKYTASTSRGVQFVIKSGKDLKDIILIDDVRNFRKIQEGAQIEDIDWSNRGMSYTGLSSWIASLFPYKLYPTPMKGFNETIDYLFGCKSKKLPKTGKNYILNCQPYLKETEEILKQYPLEDVFLTQWNKHYLEKTELEIEPKSKLSKTDWVWIVQDFHLFTLREILEITKEENKGIKVADTSEPTTIEGNSVLATHLRYERDSSFIKRIKEKALSNNLMLNCEICGFSFLDTYGLVGRGFIEAHHINPLNEREGKQVTKKGDIALVCSNCHRMLHRKISDKYLSIEDIKKNIITRHNNLA